MRKNYWSNDDYYDYDNYDDDKYFSDYDYYYGNGGRRNQNRRDNYGRQSNYSRRDDYDRQDNRRGRSGFKYTNNYRKNEEVTSGVMYLLMTVFFGVVIITVMLGRLYLNNDSMETDDDPVPVITSSSESETSSQPEPVDSETQKIEEELDAMSIEQKVGQLFMVRNNGKGSLIDTVAQTNAGGVILFADDFKGKTADEVRGMISEIQSCSDGRMMIAVDEEGGTVVRVSSNTKLRSSKFLSPQRLYAKGGFDLIVSDTEEKCELLHSLGINMNMAPVADVCTSSSGFIYNRSFGKGADETAEYVSMVVTTMKETPVASCVKHFPGYGNSKSDTHQKLDVNEKSLDELTECDLVPFEAAIRDGADSIMLTHTVINAIDPDHPASLSPEVVELLREDMGFEGLLITDGLEMGAIVDYSGANTGKICVMAVIAGVDVLCAPKNPVSDYNAVLEAVRSGVIDERRIDESVRRILKLKLKFE